MEEMAEERCDFSQRQPPPLPGPGVRKEGSQGSVQQSSRARGQGQKLSPVLRSIKSICHISNCCKMPLCAKSLESEIL